MTVTFFALVFVLFLLYLILPFLGDAFIGHVELMSPKDKNNIALLPFNKIVLLETRKEKIKKLCFCKS